MEMQRPEYGGLRERQIMIAYKVINEELREGLETMPAQEALRLFKDILLRLV